MEGPEEAPGGCPPAAPGDEPSAGAPEAAGGAPGAGAGAGLAVEGCPHRGNPWHRCGVRCRERAAARAAKYGGPGSLPPGAPARRRLRLAAVGPRPVPGSRPLRPWRPAGEDEDARAAEAAAEAAAAGKDRPAVLPAGQQARWRMRGWTL